MSEQTYGHICDNCETPAYPLRLVQVRTSRGEIKDYWVCDDCTSAFEQEVVTVTLELPVSYFE